MMHQKPSSSSPDTGGLVFFFLCLSCVLLAFLPSQTRWIDGTILVKQPAFWSIVSIGIMLVFSIIALLVQKKSILQNGKDLVHCLLQKKSLYVIECCLYYLAYVWLVPLLGYLLSSILFMVILTWRYGFRTKTMLLSSAITAIAIVVIFKTIMQLKIPAGQIYDFLPEPIRQFFLVNF